MRMREITNEGYGDEDDEDALIHHRRMTKRGYSSQQASQVTGYVPPARSYPRRPAVPARTYPSAASAANGRQYLNVPYADKDIAKAAALSIQKKMGWDPEKVNPVTNKKGCWYVDASAGDHDSLRKWQIK